MTTISWQSDGTHRAWAVPGYASRTGFEPSVISWAKDQERAASAEQAARRWARLKEARDDYAARHGGYNSSGFAIPGEVAAAARGER